MKRLFLTVLSFFVLIGVCFGAGTTTAIPLKIGSGSGYTVAITATADASTAAFVPIKFDNSNNRDTWGAILGKWLTSARTTISATSAPTANYDIFIYDTDISSGGHILTTPTLAIGSTTTRVSSVYFNYSIAGTAYSKAAVSAGTSLGTTTVLQAKYGAVALDIDASGTITAVPATANDTTGYDSAAEAIAGVAAVAATKARMGYVTVTKSDGDFTFDSTAFNAANVTTAYLSTIPVYDIMGGRLSNRSATASEEVYPANTAGDNVYIFIKEPITIVFVNNSVNSAVVLLDLIFN